MDVETTSTGYPSKEPQPAVFFDLDRTIIEGSSISQFGMAAWRAGLIDPKKMGTQLIRGLLFDWIGESEGVADEALPKILETIKGKERSEMMELRGPLVEKMLAEARPETLRLLGFHARMGRDCYVVSASAIEIVGRELSKRCVLRRVVDAVPFDRALSRCCDTGSANGDSCWAGRRRDPRR